MSQPAIFKLIVQDKRYDKYFTATELLKSALARAKIKAQSTHSHVDYSDITRTHYLYIRKIFRPYVAVASEYIRVKHSGSTSSLVLGNSSLEFRLPNYGHFTSDLVLHIKLSAVGTETPIVQDPPPAAIVANPSPQFQYTAYPGIRMLNKVSFISTETVIDDYTSDDVSFVNKFEIPSDRRTAWDKCMGQSELRRAEFTANNFTGCMFYKEGLQTPSFYHGPTDLWIPLQFWFCKDTGQVLFNDTNPNTQRTIRVELASIDKIIRQLSQAGVQETLSLSRLNLQADLYANTLFVTPDVYDIFSARGELSLMRVHKRQTKILSAETGAVLLDQLKYPAEYMYVGVRDLQNANSFNHWHLYGRAKVRTNQNQLFMPAAVWNNNLAVCEFVCRAGVELTTLEPIVDSLTIAAHGIDLYPQNPPSFFNAYLPQKNFNDARLVCPEDSSALLISFCLYPGLYNPSGYFNMSTARELYINYVAQGINSFNQAGMVISMYALNFLVRNGDHLSLRYSV